MVHSSYFTFLISNFLKHLSTMISDFAKEKVFWTRKMNLKLVKFIESRPNIWNPKHPKYTSVLARDQTYAEFASHYGNEFTWQAVKDRWTNIRSTFANYLRKVNVSNLKSEGEPYKVNWHLWEPCSFLLKVNRKINNLDNLYEQKVDETEGTKIREQNLSEEELSDNNSNKSNSGYCFNVAKNMVQVFRAVQNDAFGLENTKYAQLGRAVIKKLSQLNSYEATQMTHKITEILLMYDKSNPINPNNLKIDFS